MKKFLVVMLVLSFSLSIYLTDISASYSNDTKYANITLNIYNNESKHVFVCVDVDYPANRMKKSFTIMPESKYTLNLEFKGSPYRDIQGNATIILSEGCEGINERNITIMYPLNLKKRAIPLLTQPTQNKTAIIIDYIESGKKRFNIEVIIPFIIGFLIIGIIILILYRYLIKEEF